MTDTNHAEPGGGQAAARDEHPAVHPVAHPLAGVSVTFRRAFECASPGLVQPADGQRLEVIDWFDRAVRYRTDLSWRDIEGELVAAYSWRAVQDDRMWRCEHVVLCQDDAGREHLVHHGELDTGTVKLTERMRDLLWTVAQHKYGWTHVSRHQGGLQVADALERRALVTYLDGADGRDGRHPKVTASEQGRREIARRWPVSPYALGTYDHQPSSWTPVSGGPWEAPRRPRAGQRARSPL